jgi:hypothetical protein
VYLIKKNVVVIFNFNELMSFDDVLHIFVLYCFYKMSQGAQAVGMGKEAQNVPTAAELYKKANDILG